VLFCWEESWWRRDDQLLTKGETWDDKASKESSGKRRGSNRKGMSFWGGTTGLMTDAAEGDCARFCRKYVGGPARISYLLPRSGLGKGRNRRIVLRSSISEEGRSNADRLRALQGGTTCCAEGGNFRKRRGLTDGLKGNVER